MPTYEYNCPHGHAIEHFGRMRDEQPAAIRCEVHGCDAPRGVTACAVAGVAPVQPSQEWTDEERARRQAPPDLGTFNYRCEPCDHAFVEINDFRAGESPDTPRPCPKCGAASPMTFTAAHVDGTLVMYPYHDRGLDRWFSSAQERREYCKANGLIPVEGDFDAGRMYADSTRRDRQQAEAYREIIKGYDGQPWFEQYKDEYKARHGTDYVPPT